MRDVWPFATLVTLIMSACLALGADSSSSALTFSALLLAFSVIIVLVRRPRLDVVTVAWLAGAVALAGLGVLKGWMSTGASEYASLIAGAGVFLVAREGGRSTERSDRLWLVTLGLGALVGFASFVDFIVDPRTIFGFERHYQFERMSAPFLSPNTAATFYGVIALMAVTSLLRGLRQCRGRRPDAYARVLVLPVAALVVTVTCLFLTGSRAGISLFVLCAVGLSFWRSVADWRKGGSVRSLATPLLVVIAVLVVFGVSGGVYSARLAQVDAQLSENVRVQQFAAYWSAVWYAPVLGQGLGGFPFMARLYEMIDTPRGVMMPNAAHNLFLQWMLQAGSVGTLGGAAVLAGLVQQVRRGLSRRRRQRELLRGLLVVIVFVLAHAMVDFALEISGFFWLFCWMLGLGAGIANRSKSDLRSAGWPVTGALAAVLALAAGVSALGARDHLAADRILMLSDARFVARHGQTEASGHSARYYEAIGDRALRLVEPDYGLAYWAFSRSLAEEPRDGEVWGKRAFAGYHAFGVMTEAGIEDLRRSYLLLPYGGQSYLQWRSRFVLEVWAELPDDVRAAAQRESRALPGRAYQRWLTGINDADA
ncbi:O-antigen ligase family protein [Oceanicaulis sp. LC35]|uniref:O-antigen ligase family protein n=1 Tax=Oceanicaulis sp. LC35 TaxID=3349635 RepID=UPI003F876D16